MNSSGSPARRLAWVGLLYFAEGLPLGLLNDLLPVAYRQAGVSLEQIGLLQVVALPWTLKFLWAPAVDRWGSRQIWFRAALAGLALVVVGLVVVGPTSFTGPVLVILVLLALLGATQDIAIDAYSIELLPHRELGLANGVRVTTYRLALVVTGGAAVALSEVLGWSRVLLGIAALFGVLAWSTRSTPRPVRPSHNHPIGAGFVAPVRDLLHRPGAAAVLVFVVLFKLGDAAMAPMVRPFLVDAGLRASEIGLLAGTLGVLALTVGALVGGAFASKYGLFRGLWVLGVIQAGTNLFYAYVAWEPTRTLIWLATLFEAFAYGLGTAAFLAFLMAICQKRYAATQYALLSALFGLGRALAGSVSGFGAAHWGYSAYFVVTFFLALPAFGLLPWVRGWVGQPHGA